MNRLSLIKNPELFQGKNRLLTNNKYFEGWYFKNTNENEGISFIPGINIEGLKAKAFIQIITNNSSYFVNYSIEEFYSSEEPFYIKIGNNIFSKDEIHIEITDTKQNLKIYGDLKYKDNTSIKCSMFSPNIMGPFSYIPFMECNHAVISMRNNIQGNIKINENNLVFNEGIGYIEKDWGISFPKSYLWCQANNFKNSNASFMLSVANIPLKGFEFTGFISTLIYKGKEYKFTTYNNAKLIKKVIDKETLNIELKKGNYILKVFSVNNKNNKLLAPTNGRMNKSILESISANINIILKYKKQILFADTSKNCGLEIVE